MDIMELGAIGEMVGGAAVVASLIFVGIQIRHNSELTRESGRIASGTTFHQMNVMYADFFRPIAQDPELAAIYRKGRAGEDLDADEVVRYEALLQLHVSWLEDVYLQQALGFGARAGVEAMSIFGSFSDAPVMEQFAPFTRQLLTGAYAKE